VSKLPVADRRQVKSSFAVPGIAASEQIPIPSKEAAAMRFMMIMKPNISEEDWSPNPEAIATMSKYNDELTRAGVLLALDGLAPTAQGARVSFAGGKPTVTDGPFTESKELIGGYWLIQAQSKEEAVQWASRCPAADGDVIEVRQVYEMSDFDV
jgi:hypothetical protein